MVHVCPALTRDFVQLDRTLCNASTLIEQMHREEQQREEKHQRQRQKNSAVVSPAKKNKNDAATAAPARKPMFSMLNWTQTAALEESVGAMSHSLSQIMDGAGCVGG